MAKKTVFVSDLSGEPITEGRGARITIRYHDARKGVAVLDVSDEEADELARKGGRRGRRPRAVPETSSEG